MMEQESLRSLLADVPSYESAPRLVGGLLITKVGVAQIVEVEAYGGLDDPGSHAFGGETPRCRSVFGEPGRAYVYISYGMHRMLNVVARPSGIPSAILIRAGKPLSGLEEMRRRRMVEDRKLLSGPGCLTQAMGIGMEHDYCDLLDASSEVRILAPLKQRPYLIGKRIGIAVGRGDLTPWRYLDEELLGWRSATLPRL